MLINIQQSENVSFEDVAVKTLAKSSTYKERVNADRVAMLLLFIATIVFQIITS